MNRLASVPGFTLTLLLCCLCRLGNASPRSTPQSLTLPGGVRLILQPEPDASLTAISILVRTERDGTSQERAVGDLVAHALWYGGDGANEWSAASLGKIGGVFETLRTPDFVAVNLVTVPEQAEEAADTLCEALTHADFNPDALAGARRDLHIAHRLEEHGLQSVIQRVQASLEPVEAPNDDLTARVTRAQALDYFQRRYLSTQTIITVVGSFSSDAVRTAFEAHLVDFARRPRYAPDLSLPNPPFATVHRLDDVSLDVPSACAVVGSNAPRVDSPDYPAFLVLSALLGGGHTSRLFHNLRDTEGIGYHVGLLFRADRSDPMIAYLEWDPHRPASHGSPPPPSPAGALKLLDAQFRALLAAPPDEQELGRARQLAITREALRHARVRDRAFLLGWYEAMGVGSNFDDQLPRRIAQVTSKDLYHAARLYLRYRSMAVGVPKPNPPAPLP